MLKRIGKVAGNVEPEQVIEVKGIVTTPLTYSKALELSDTYRRTHDNQKPKLFVVHMPKEIAGVPVVFV